MFVKVAFLLAAASAAIASVVPNFIINPPITSPVAGQVWKIGSKQNVTWDTSEIPPLGAQQTGMVVLAFIIPVNGQESLDIDHPLATGFLLTDGQVEVTVPNVRPADSFIIALFGDATNISPEFTITP